MFRGEERGDPNGDQSVSLFQGPLHHISFSADRDSVIAVGKDGLRRWGLSPFRELSHLPRFRYGALALAAYTDQPQGKRNPWAFVVASDRPNEIDHYPPNQVVRLEFGWETAMYAPGRRRVLLPTRRKGFYAMGEKVLNIKTNSRIAVIVTEHSLHFIRLSDPSANPVNLGTARNPYGVCDLTLNPQLAEAEGGSHLVAFPGPKTGSIQFYYINEEDLVVSEKVEASSTPVTLKAHNNSIRSIAINSVGTIVATASSNGTLIRLWDTCTRLQLTELRRGADPAIIHCIAFSGDSQFLCVSSDKGTVHVFALKDYRLNKRWSLANVIPSSKLSDIQYSYASFSVGSELPCVCAFSHDNKVIYAACLDGSVTSWDFPVDLTSSNLTMRTINMVTQNCGDECWNLMTKLAMYFPRGHWQRPRSNEERARRQTNMLKWRREYFGEEENYKSGNTETIEVIVETKKVLPENEAVNEDVLADLAQACAEQM